MNTGRLFIALVSGLLFAVSSGCSEPVTSTPSEQDSSSVTTDMDIVVPNTDAKAKSTGDGS